MPDEYFRIAFYVVAHADDWQIFLNPNAYHDLMSPHTKVVFIITTAGDAGGDNRYWAAREDGCKSSIRFCLSPLLALSELTGIKKFNQHDIAYWSANNSTCYFFRLPDGNLDGKGFPTNHNQSLCRLREGQISRITAVDNSTTYNAWQDFHSTLQTIIQYESQGKSSTWINYLNPDTGTNINDHTDHITTGQAIQNMTIISTLHQALFRGYSNSSAQEKLGTTDLFWKAGMFAAYEKAVYDGSGYSTLKEGLQLYIRWCTRSPDFIIVNP